MEDHRAGREADWLARTLALAILTLRARRGWTQKRMARELSTALGKPIAQTYICRVEKGETGVTTERLQLFLDVLGFSFADLAAAAAAQHLIDGLTEVEQLKRLAADSA